MTDAFDLLFSNKPLIRKEEKIGKLVNSNEKSSTIKTINHTNQIINKPKINDISTFTSNKNPTNKEKPIIESNKQGLVNTKITPKQDNNILNKLKYSKEEEAFLNKLNSLEILSEKYTLIDKNKDLYQKLLIKENNILRENQANLNKNLDRDNAADEIVRQAQIKKYDDANKTLLNKKRTKEEIKEFMEGFMQLMANVSGGIPAPLMPVVKEASLISASFS